MTAGSLLGREKWTVGMRDAELPHREVASKYHPWKATFRYKGSELNFVELACLPECDVTPETIRYRIRYSHWSVLKAVTTPNKRQINALTPELRSCMVSDSTKISNRGLMKKYRVGWSTVKMILQEASCH